MSIIKNTEELNNLLEVVQKLPVKKDEQKKVVDITENGTTVVTPDEGMVLSKVTVNTAIESDGDGLPDWDDDSQIIATGISYYTDNTYWELTEKGTLYWRIKDLKGATRALFNGSSLSLVPLEYQAISTKIKQIYVSDGITAVSLLYAPYCERIRFADTLTDVPSIATIGCKEVDISKIAASTIGASMCNGARRLEKVLFKSSTKTIPEYAFRICHALKEIDLSNITTFQTGCFEECFSLDMDITFNSGLISIGNNAFAKTRIKSINFQNSADSLPTISASAFGDCRALTDIYCPWEEGAVANAPWGAKNAAIHYNTTYDENGNPIVTEE